MQALQVASFVMLLLSFLILTYLLQNKYYFYKILCLHHLQYFPYFKILFMEQSMIFKIIFIESLSYTMLNACCELRNIFFLI